MRLSTPELKSESQGGVLLPGHRWGILKWPSGYYHLEKEIKNREEGLSKINNIYSWANYEPTSRKAKIWAIQTLLKCKYDLEEFEKEHPDAKADENSVSEIDEPEKNSTMPLSSDEVNHLFKKTPPEIIDLVKKVKPDIIKIYEDMRDFVGFTHIIGDDKDDVDDKEYMTHGDRLKFEAQASLKRNEKKFSGIINKEDLEDPGLNLYFFPPRQESREFPGKLLQKILQRHFPEEKKIAIKPLSKIFHNV